MKLLHFVYDMNIEFDSPVCQHQFTVKCHPVSTKRQKVLQLQTSVEPKESLSQGIDAFGNVCIFGYAAREHQLFSIHTEGTVRTGMSSYEKAAPRHQIGMFCYQSPLTIPGKHLKEYAASFAFDRQESNFSNALTIMERVHEDIKYESGSTLITTTAEDAYMQGKGVCQDYSHIMIALCRLFRIPARYVVGMLIGEGASHAWVEIYDGGMWIGLDPTNNLIVDDQHIKISSGRDYSDCLINQGLFTGSAAQTQRISVHVQEMKEG